eukprot:TRINITY_DN490_c0_g3_i1.p1 TRINITY_DN490_c0_g3~~TRINITY_DN490_c0_g3_i1.p1  ORF type:complete len:682 (+),score=155.94 TRINITY_DN490_c0_g3_i1:94-2046(+)
MGNVFSANGTEHFVRRAIASYQKGDLTATLETLKEAIEAEEKREGGPRGEVLATLQDNAAVVYRTNGNFKECILYHKLSIEQRELIGRATCSGYCNIASLYEMVGDLAQALIYYNKALNMDMNGGHQQQPLQPPQPEYSVTISLDRLETLPETNVSSLLFTIGTLEERLGDWKAALSSYGKSACIIQELDMSDRVSSSALAAVYNKMGNIVKTNMGAKEALSHFMKALEVDEKYHEDQVIADSNAHIGLLYQDMGSKYDTDSLEYLQKSCQVKPSPENLQHLATLQRKLKQYKAAVESYKAALDLRRDPSKPSNDTPQNIFAIMRLLEHIGLTLKEHGSFTASMKYLAEAVRFREKHKKYAKKGEHTPEMEAGLASAYTLLGIVSQTAGKLADAICLFEKSRDLLLQLEAASVVKGSMSLAAAYNNLGLAQQQTGNLTQALENFESAMNIAKETPSEANALARASFINNLGSVYKASGDFEKAATCCRETLEIRRKKAPNSNILAISYMNTGVLEKEAGKLESAMELFTAAKTIQEKVAPNSLSIAATYDCIGMLHKQTGNLKEATSFCRQSLAIRERDAPNSLQAAASYTSIGTLQEEMGDFQEASLYYKKALAINLRDAPKSQSLAATNQKMIEFTKMQDGPEELNKE